jgi:hypothetical protein
VPEGDGRELPADGRHLGPAGRELRNVEADGADGGQEGFQACLASPLFEEPEIGPVCPLGGRAPGGLLVLASLLGGLEQRVARCRGPLN